MKFSLFIKIFISLFIASILLLGSINQEPKKGAIIKGTLIAEEEGTSLEGISFYLLKLPFDKKDLMDAKKRKKLFKKMVFCPMVGETATDSEGKFVFEEVKVGNYFISAALTETNVIPGQDYVMSGDSNLVIIVEAEDDVFDLKIKVGKELRSVNEQNEKL
jgi:hypothetical protein